MSIRIPQKADTDTQSAFQDVEKALAELSARLDQVTDLEQKVKELSIVSDTPRPSFITQGDTVIEGDLRVEGGLAVRGDVDAPQVLDGIVVATPEGIGSSAQRVVEVHGSLTVLNALSAHTVRTARLDARPVFWRARRSTTKSISDSTLTTVDFDTLLTDNVAFTNPSNEGRATIEYGGLYLIGFNVEWAANATGIRSVLLFKNGTTNIGVHTQVGFSASVNRQIISVVQYLSPADFIQAQVYQTSTGSLDLTTQDDFAPVFYGIRLSS